MHRADLTSDLTTFELHSIPVPVDSREELRMENYGWLLFFFVLGVLALMQLAGIHRSVQGTEAMMRRFLSDQGIEWEAAVEPSARVKELALNATTYVAAIKAYREQTGLGLREAKAVIDELSRSRPGAA
jgi:hypothetical protein